MMRETMALVVNADANEESGMRFYLWPTSNLWLIPDDDVKLAEVEVCYSMPDNMTPEDIRRAAVETLKEKQKHAYAKAEERVNRLQERINKLQMLTYQPAADAEPINTKEERIYDHDRTGFRYCDPDDIAF